MKRCRLRLGLSITLAFLLALPFLQKTTHVFPRVVLTGSETAVAKPNWSLRSWFSGEATRQFEAYFAKKIGFRGLFVKALNQFNFSVFGEITGNKGTAVLQGKDHWLYEKEYVRHYTERVGMDPLAMIEFVDALKKLQDGLAKHGIAFLLVISPSKAEVYPEFLPEGISAPSPSTAGKNAYEITAPQLSRRGVHHVDAFDLFRQWKPHSEPLYARTGTHWNYYGAALVAREALRRITLTSGPSIPLPEIASVNYAQPIGTDEDLELLLNLLWIVPRGKRLTPYPVVETDAVPMNERRNVLLVGDSFSFTLIDALNISRVARTMDLFYYFKRTYSYAGQDEPELPRSHVEADVGPIDYASIDWQRFLFSKDIVILEMNQILIPERGWGFIDAALQALDAASPNEE